MFYVLKNFMPKLRYSSHSYIRRFFIMISMLYSYINAVNQYCLIGFYFVFLWMILKTMFKKYCWTLMGPLATIDTLMVFVYLCCVFSLFFISLFYNRPEKKPYIFSLSSSLLGLYLLFQFLVFLYIVVIIYFMPPPR